MGNNEIYPVHKKLTEIATVMSDNVESKAKIIKQGRKRYFIFCKIKIH